MVIIILSEKDMVVISVLMPSTNPAACLVTAGYVAAPVGRCGREFEDISKGMISRRKIESIQGLRTIGVSVERILFMLVSRIDNF